MLPHLSGKSGSRFPNARTTKGKPHGMVLRAAQRQQFLIGVLENAVQTAFEEGNPVAGGAEGNDVHSLMISQKLPLPPVNGENRE